MMSKKSVVLLTLICTMILIPVISAQPNQLVTSAQQSKPLRCFMVMFIDQSEPAATIHWRGFVFGDINGKLDVWENRPQTNKMVPPGEIFYEQFFITTCRGTIVGYDVGVWDLSTFKWHADGYVSSATGEWACLKGFSVSEQKGMTTDPSKGNIVTGWATITIYK
jgi:hypothetical protein